MAIILISDLPVSMQSHELVEVLVAGANAKASRVAPCLVSTDPAPSEAAIDEARLILLGAIKRWVDAGSGAFSQMTAGSFSASTDTRQRTGFNLWPSEVTALQEICAAGTAKAKSFAVDMAPSGGVHVPWCALAFGALYCSCGSDINNYEGPLYEGGILSPDPEWP